MQLVAFGVPVATYNDGATDSEKLQLTKVLASESSSALSYI